MIQAQELAIANLDESDIIVGSDRVGAHGYVICVAHHAGQQKASDDHRWLGRMIVTTARAGTRGFSLRALIACFCAVAVVTTTFSGSVRSSAAATGDQGLFIPIVSVATTGAPAKRPCQRSGLVPAGAVCNVGVFVGVENSTPHLIKRFPKQARLGPALRSELATQCCGSPLLRPPRIDV